MEIPEGISFGSKVAVIPGYLSPFTHSGHMNDLRKKLIYRWINRGDVIGLFEIKGSYDNNIFSRTFNSKTHTANIKSPVSGLVLHSTLKHTFTNDFERWNSGKGQTLANFAILLPDDEPKTESGNFMYHQMCRLVKDMSHYYLRKSRYWSMGAYTLEDLDEYIKLQLNTNPLIFDALPHWGDYLDEVRIKYPELRPYIKHLSTNM